MFTAFKETTVAAMLEVKGLVSQLCDQFLRSSRMEVGCGLRRHIYPAAVQPRPAFSVLLKPHSAWLRDCPAVRGATSQPLPLPGALEGYGVHPQNLALRTPLQQPPPPCPTRQGVIQYTGRVTAPPYQPVEQQQQHVSQPVYQQQVGYQQQGGYSPRP